MRLQIVGARQTAKHLALAFLVTGTIAALLPVAAADEPPREWDGLVRVSSKNQQIPASAPGSAAIMMNGSSHD